MDKRADLAMALVVILVGAFYFFLASQMRIGRTYDPLGPAALPKILAIVFILGSLWIVINRLRTWRRTSGWRVEAEGEVDTPGYPASFKPVLLLVILTALYIGSLSVIGFVIATPLWLALGLLVLAVRSWKQIVGVSLGLTGILFLVFEILLKVHLPMGFLS